MKNQLLIPTITVLVFAVSCTQQLKDAPKTAQADTLKRVTSKTTTAGDKINTIDANNNRQGHWKIFNAETHFPEYTDTALIEEGDYKDGMKEGIWVYYAPNGQVDIRVEFKEDKPVKTY
ncbi:MAG TPA: hypothetical protein VK806_12215 [Bacteroidia bacterium]|jgi:hypothetical protein|nr:hypothetical protein [Bacteroidia bacterium]